jgi:PA domain
MQIPKSLQKPGDGYDHRDALFGIPPYGGSIQQQLYYTPAKLCNPSMNMSNVFPTGEKGGQPQAPFILMVDRGDCTFVMKVRHAQRAGASGVLIADNVCQCAATDCTSSEPCESTEPLMADDGSGSDISIPAFLVFKQDADPIKQALKANQQVRVEMSFSIPTANSRVEYDLWTTPKDPVSQSFLKTFRSAAVSLGKDAAFTPHMYIYDGRRAGCQDSYGENQCFTLCTNSGLYCATDPDNDLDAGISGADIVTESLRRLCIWDKYGRDGIGAQWWDYVKQFSDMCDTIYDANSFTNPDCISEAMKKAGVDADAVKKCMSESGGLEGNKTNTLLEGELSHRETSGVVVIPTLFVDQAPVRGALSFSTVLKALCAGYAPGSEPSICTTCASCQDEEKCVNAGGKCSAASGNGGVSLQTFVGALFALSGIFLCVGLVQYKRQQSYMRDQVRGILAEYMPLDERQRRAMDTSVGISDADSPHDGHGDLQFTIS